MTPEEKDKLFTAIGYSGSMHNLTLPKKVITLHWRGVSILPAAWSVIGLHKFQLLTAGNMLLLVSTLLFSC